METTKSELDEMMKDTNQEPVEVNDDMSFLSTSQDTSKYEKFYFAKLFTKKEKPPYFSFSRSEKGVVVEVTTKDLIQTLSGKLTKITFGSYEHEKETLKTVRFNLETLNNEGKLVGFSFSIGWNYALINFVNCLLGYDKPIEGVVFGVWKDKQSGYNKSMIRINGQKPLWRYANKDLEDKKEKVYDKKGVLVATRNGDLIDFLEAELKAHLPVILPNFHPTDEPEHHTVNFVEVGIDTVLGVVPEDDSKAIDEFFGKDITIPLPKRTPIKKK